MVINCKRTKCNDRTELFQCQPHGGAGVKSGDYHEDSSSGDREMTVQHFTAIYPIVVINLSGPK